MKDRRLSHGLTALGIIGILVGLAGAVFSLVSLQARMERLTFELEDSIFHVEQAIGLVRDHEAATASAQGLLQSGGGFLQQTPGLFTALGGNAAQAADTLNAFSQLLDGIKQGALANLAVADPDLKRAAVQTHRLAAELRLLDGKLQALARTSRPLADGVDRLTARLANLRSALARSRVGLESLQGDLEQMRQAIRGAELPQFVAGVGVLGGGLYVFLGLLALALARMQRR